MKDNFKLISGALAVGIYLSLIAILLYYFNYRSSESSVHYVKKNNDAIAVSLASGRKKSIEKKGKKATSSKKAKEKPKKIRNITSPNKTVQKSKKTKKKAKKIKTKSLFSSIKTPAKKSKSKASKRSEKTASQRVAESMKKTQLQDKGVENRYFASVEEKLRGWPAQANYAGEQISVWLKVYPSGSFEFKIQKFSANSEFNEALIAYLKQLQEIGLGRHSNPKPYQIEVEFEARE